MDKGRKPRKKGRKPGMQDTRTERGRWPPVPPLYGSSVGYLLRRRISNDTLGKERDHWVNCLQYRPFVGAQIASVSFVKEGQSNKSVLD